MRTPEKKVTEVQVVGLLSYYASKLLFEKGWTMWRQGRKERFQDSKRVSYDYYYIGTKQMTYEQEEAVRSVLVNEAQVPEESIEFSHTQEQTEIRIINEAFQKLKERLPAITVGIRGTNQGRSNF